MVYAVVELAVIVALASTIGFGWTVLLLLASFVVGVALAGSQVKRHIRRLQSGLTLYSPQGAVTDGALVALGSVLVVVPGLVTSVAGLLLSPRPPARSCVRWWPGSWPAVGAGCRRSPSPPRRPPGTRPGRGQYIDGEVVDVEDMNRSPAAPSPIAA